MEEVGAEDLEGDDEEDDVFGEWLWPAELSYLLRLAIEEQEGRERDTDLWMRFDDGLSSCAMWFLGVCPEEIMFLDL